MIQREAQTYKTICKSCGKMGKVTLERGDEQVKCNACDGYVEFHEYSQDLSKPVSGWVIAGYIFAVLGGWLGVAISVGILMGDKKDKKHGIAILVISVFSQALWKSMLK